MFLVQWQSAAVIRCSLAPHNRLVMTNSSVVHYARLEMDTFVSFPRFRHRTSGILCADHVRTWDLRMASASSAAIVRLVPFTLLTFNSG